MLILRDMLEQDIADNVRWFTTETEWSDWDAPWEPIEGGEDEQRASWTEYYEAVKDAPPEVFRWKREIELDGVHIGWVSSYTDLEYLDKPEEHPAVGICIIPQEARGRGAGTEALRQFIDDIRAHGHSTVYTQTWSGNLPMIRLAEKLGFREVCRKPQIREVRGQRYDAITFRLDLGKDDHHA